MPESSEKIFFPWKTFSFEAFLFSLTLILGIFTALNWQELFKFQNLQPQPISFWRFLFYFLFGTLLILSISLLSRKFQSQKRAIFKIFFVFSSVFGMLYVFFPFLNIFSLILIIFLICVWLKKPTVLLNNLLIVFGLAGFGGILGLSFQPPVIVFLLFLFSIYDFIAVYKTKHMIKMAREMIEAKIIFGIVIPQNISDFKANLKEVEPGGRFLILGGAPHQSWWGAPANSRPPPYRLIFHNRIFSNRTLV